MMLTTTPSFITNIYIIKNHYYCDINKIGGKKMNKKLPITICIILLLTAVPSINAGIHHQKTTIASQKEATTKEVTFYKYLLGKQVQEIKISIKATDEQSLSEAVINKCQELYENDKTIQDLSDILEYKFLSSGKGKRGSIGCCHLGPLWVSAMYMGEITKASSLVKKNDEVINRANGTYHGLAAMLFSGYVSWFGTGIFQFPTEIVYHGRAASVSIFYIV